MPDRDRDTIERFYAAFARLDGAAMQACYADDARFDDEAFSLQGAREVGGMWRMLTDATRANPAALARWKLDVSRVTERSAHWEAHYLFGGRPVVNRIDAEFEFDGQGRITRHRDRFDFWRWARQALGVPGWLLGWSPWLRAKVRAQAATKLQRYLAGR